MQKSSQAWLSTFIASALTLSISQALAAPNESLEDLLLPPTENTLPNGAALRFGFKSLNQGSGIRGFAISPDGRITASSGYLAGAAIKLRKFGSRQLMAELIDDPRGSGSLVFSPDGKLLAAGSNADGSVRIWDPDLGTRLSLLRTADYPQFGTNLPTWVSFAPDGDTLATASPLGTVEVWDTSTWRVIDSVVPASKAPNLRKKLCRAIAISPDGNLLAVATSDGMIRVYEYPTLKLRADIGINVLTLEINDIEFSPDSRLLAYTGTERSAKFKTGEGSYLYDLEKKREIRNLAGDLGNPAPLGYGSVITFLPGGDRLCLLDINGSVSLWETDSGEMLYLVRTGGANMAVSPDGESFATAGHHGEIKYWRMTDGQEINQPPGSEIPQARVPKILAVALPADESIALTAMSTGEVYVWDRRSGELKETVSATQNRLPGAHSAVFLPDGEGVIFGSGANVQWFDVDTGETQDWTTYPAEGDTHRFARGRMTAAAVSRDGSTAVTLNRERVNNTAGILRIWNVADGKLRSSIPVSKETRVQSSLSPDGAVLYAVEQRPRKRYGYDEIIQLYDTSTGEPIRQFEQNEDQAHLQMPGVSPDGKQLAFGDNGDSVQFWDISDGKIISYLYGPLSGGGIIRTWYSDDGKRMAANASLRGKIDDSSEITQVWDLGTGRITHQFEVLSRDLALSPDASQMAVVSTDNSVLLYDLTLEHLKFRDDPPPATEELEAAYQQIGGGPFASMDQQGRYDLYMRMVSGGDATIEFLRSKFFIPLKEERKMVMEVVDQLRSEDDTERLEAVKRVGAMGDDFWKLASTAQDAPLNGASYARLRFLAARIPDQRRIRLILHVVRPIGTPSAKELLNDLIEHHSEDRVQRTEIKRARQMLEQLESQGI